ncbi:MAG: hypothetical protein HY744_08710 [Deltaproteobacteria bacterium]|nr:hypothetical protein [Deltaproteobacteria bacterium]
MSVDTQMFVGLCRTPGIPSGKCVCLDEIGRLLHAGPVAWSEPGVGGLVRSLKALAGSELEVTLGVDAEDADEAMARVLGRSGLPVKLVGRWMVEALWHSHKRRRQTVVTRALCIAQVLLVADCPPRPLAAAAAGERPQGR